MKKIELSLAVALALLPWVAMAAPEPQAVELLGKVSRTLGADTLKSVEFSGAGHSYTLGQGGSVTAPWPKFNDVSYQRTVSFEPWASKLERVRTQGEHPPRGGGGQPLVGEQRQTQVVAAGSPAATSLPDDLAVTLPQAFLKAALAATDTSLKSGSRNGKKYQVIEFTAANKATTRGWIDSDNLVERVETTIDHNVIGDTPVEATFSAYRDFGGLKFPTHIVQAQGGHPVLDLNVANVRANVTAEFSPAPAAPAPAAVTTEKLGEGVYLITGGYAAVAVEFKDHVTVIEGGQNDQRSSAVIAEITRLIPGKPITELVNTHAHFDHLGGVRAYVAEGATIVTHKSNTAYYKKLWANPHSLVPDRLAQHPQPAKFKEVDAKLVLKEGDQVVELYHLEEFGHHDGMLVAWLPRQKILVEADAFNPPAAPLTQTPAVVSTFNASLLANIERLGLDVQRIVPVHLPADNRKVTLAELQVAAGKVR